MVGTSAFLVWFTCFKKPNTLLAEGEINVADEKHCYQLASLFQLQTTFIQFFLSKTSPTADFDPFFRSFQDNKNNGLIWCYRTIRRINRLLG